MDKRIPISVFEDTADRCPDTVAVRGHDATLTYAALDRTGNEIANALIAHGFAPGSIGAVFIPNSAIYVAAIMGIQKACGVFMPADPKAPHDRQAKMFLKAAPAAVLVDKSHLPALLQFVEESGFAPPLIMVVSAASAPVIHNIDGTAPIQCASNTDRPGILPDPEDSLYIMFTSGTTGTPKAVLGRQKGLAHFVAWERTEFSLDETVHSSNLAPTTFDVSLRDIFVPLCSGGTVSVPAESTRTAPAELLDWLTHEEVNLVHIVPSVFRLLLDELERRTDPRAPLSNMRHIMLAGEPVYGRDVTRFRSLAGDDIGLVNLYGPSETTLAKLFCRLDFIPDNPERIMPLGNPISNTAVIILASNRLAEIGEIGEICIKTAFRSKGYFHDPELTAAAFVVNPLSGEPDDIIYRTGDMGRYRPDRSVEFAGRLDRQVKVSGVRVELSEVDEAVSAVQGIKQALVMPHARDNGEVSLICYYTESKAVDVDQMREDLSSQLFSAMIPSFFVRLDSFPLGINGKIDRRALPKPDALIYEDADFVAPETETEKRIAAIWAEILGIRTIGVTTSFRTLGGGSMQAIRCAGHIARDLGIDLGIRDLLEAETVRVLAARIDGKDASRVDAPIPRQPERPDYPATHSQKRLWLLDSMLPNFTAFNIGGCYRVNGKFDESALERAIGAVIERHEILRTVFFERGGELRQRVLPPADFQIDHPVATSPKDSPTEIADSYARRVFDLAHGPLLRAGIVRDKGQLLIVFVIHHIISDAWSIDVILRETMSEYDLIAKGKPSSTSTPTLQYRDFAAWQHARLNSGELDSQRLFWLNAFKDGLPRLELPLDAPRPSRRSYHGATAPLIMPAALLEKAQAYAASHDATMFSVLLAGLRALLFRYTGQSNVILNSPVTLRGRHELDAIPGDFTNTILLACTIDDEMPFAELVKEAVTNIDQAMRNREYPFDLLIQELNVKGDLSRAPVTDVGITLVEDYGDASPAAGLSLDPVEMDESISKYDMVFHFNLTSSGLSLVIEYDAVILHKDRIERMANNLSTLLLNALDQPDTTVSALPIIDPTEQSMITRFQLPNRRGYPDSTIHGAFCQVARKQPNACALVLDDGSEMTFAELDRESNRVAAMLTANGCAKGSRIAVHLSRGHHVPIAILGILKAGCVYVPVADDLPLPRIAYMIDDCGVVAAITGDDLAANLPDSVTRLAIADADQHSDAHSDVDVAPGDEAYVIYTSGSTGKPKGVRLPHLGLVNRTRDLCERAAITSQDRFTQFASLSFDASLYEIFASLLNGASLVVVTRDTINDTDALLGFIEDRGVTFTLLPPTYVRRLSRRPLPGVRVLKTAGEAADITDSLHYSRSMLCLNGYGPTEDSICSSIFVVDPGRQYPLGIPIGTPVADTEALVLDKAMQPVPIGVPGQLCVSDNGLSLGYLNRPEDTDLTFVSHPFDPDRRMYLTGDLARWEPDGNLLFLGRIDQQVKIGGHRIEPGEIEHALRELSGVENACVIPVGESDDKRLAAYYSGKANDSFLRTGLAVFLPSYMIPNYFVKMDSLPMSLSGKVDRKALPSITESRDQEDIDEGGTAAETILLEVIREVLGSQAIGIKSNFFSVGGDSIRAIQVASTLRERGWSLSAGAVFATPVIGDLARDLSRTIAEVSTEPVSGPVIATPILKWFTEAVTIDTAHFNQAVMLRSKVDIDWEALSAAMKAIWRHHDTLRMVLTDEFTIKPADAPFAPRLVDLNASPTPDTLMLELAEEAQRSFDLANGPLFQAILFKRSDGDRLLLIAHHLVIDAVSWGILARDIETAYNQSAADVEIALPARTHSYRDWAEMLSRVTSEGAFDGELAYWQAIASADTSAVVAGGVLSHSMVSTTIHLEVADTAALLSDQSGSLETPARLLAALSSALHQWKGVSRVRIELEGHGRGFTGSNLDISRTVGWFTAAYPFLLECGGDVNTSFDKAHQALKDIPNGGIGYGALRYMARRTELETSAEIAFNYLGRLEVPESMFSITDDPLGETVSPGIHLGHALEFLLSVVNEQLEINLTYDSGVVSEDSANRLLSLYREAVTQALTCRASEYDYTGFGEGGVDAFLNSL